MFSKSMIRGAEKLHLLHLAMKSARPAAAAQMLEITRHRLTREMHLWIESGMQPDMDKSSGHFWTSHNVGNQTLSTSRFKKEKEIEGIKWNSDKWW